MTLPDERFRAIVSTRKFLRALLDPKETPKVPKDIRRWASNCLRHYPWDLYLEQIAKKCPTILEIPNEHKNEDS